MPTFASGPLSFNNIRNNFYNYTNFDGFYWGTNDGNFYNLNFYRGRRFNRGGNISTYFSSGTISFAEFYNSDGNCACDCACACSTDCTCFTGDCEVVMSDGSVKRIDEVLVGDILDGGFGYKNEVLAYHVGPLALNRLFIINGTHKTTPEHRHWTTDGWAAIDVGKATNNYTTLVNIDNDGNKQARINKRFKNTPVHALKIGMTFVTMDGETEQVESIVEDTSADRETLVYTLIMGGSHTHIANGKIVTGWAHDEDFDYSTWKPK